MLDCILKIAIQPLDLGFVGPGTHLKVAGHRLSRPGFENPCSILFSSPPHSFSVGMRSGDFFKVDFSVQGVISVLFLTICFGSLTCQKTFI